MKTADEPILSVLSQPLLFKLFESSFESPETRSIPWKFACYFICDMVVAGAELPY